jgi:hypothetical protein
VFLLVVAIAAGRLGADQQLDNLAPALVVAIAWPALVLASMVLGPVWRWLDPWDGLARALSRAERSGPAGDVRWALLPAVGWVWYLTVFPDALEPSSVGAAVLVYTVFSLGGALALGRVAWLSRAEVFGLLFGWAARVRGGLWPDGAPPRGAELVLGILGGGLVFGLLRASRLWGSLGAGTGATVNATMGVAVSAGGAAVLVWVLARWERGLGGRGSVAAAMVPAVAGLAVALALARSRLVLAVLLLPRLASDPFGAGWDLLGAAGAPLPTDPLTPAGRGLLQIGVLAAAGLLGAAVAARRAPREARGPALLAAMALLAVGALAVADA